MRLGTLVPDTPVVVLRVAIPMLTAPALPLSSRTLTFVSGLIRRHRKSIGSCWRKLNPGRQALLVLAYLRKDIPGA
jgi:hypothetical protein